MRGAQGPKVYLIRIRGLVYTRVRNWAEDYKSDRTGL